ncbi:DUF6904 family protein [Enterobacter ludwigii]|uniref:DUF6904 family protein n=1 Tax=Enterobacter ludwigii TaxID=299767 RepID=UPI0039A0F68E
MCPCQQCCLLAYDIRKAGEGCRRTEQHEYESQDTYHIYGVELLWPLILIQLALFRRSMSYIQVNKNHLSLMYAFEHILESALKELIPECWEELIRVGLCFCLGILNNRTDCWRRKICSSPD